MTNAMPKNHVDACLAPMDLNAAAAVYGGTSIYPPIVRIACMLACAIIDAMPRLEKLAANRTTCRSTPAAHDGSATWVAGCGLRRFDATLSANFR